MVRARDSVEPDLKSATDARANNPAPDLYWVLPRVFGFIRQPAPPTYSGSPI
jgi:hypothetical protein